MKGRTTKIATEGYKNNIYRFHYKVNVLAEPLRPQGTVEHSLNATERKKGSYS
jgi:hypothetical protein